MDKAEVSILLSATEPETVTEGILTIAPTLAFTLISGQNTIKSDNTIEVTRITVNSCIATYLPTLLSPHVAKGAQNKVNLIIKASSKEASTFKQDTPPSPQPEHGLGRTLSNLSLSTNKFATLDSSDDDETPILNNALNRLIYLPHPVNKSYGIDQLDRLEKLRRCNGKL